MSLPLYRPLETVSLENAIEDLVVRFIVNVPPEDLATVERVLFHFEEASWFYTDFVKLMNQNLPNMSIRTFSKVVKDICPLVWNWNISPENALVKFSNYKKTIPVRGAAIFNESLSKILLLRGVNSKHWSFPRGKIGKDEDDVTCCIREVKEEIGFDLTGYIDPDQYVERVMNGKNFKIFLVKGVPEEFDFKPEHKNEIDDIQWKDFKKLSRAIAKHESSARVFLVNGMIRPLSLYVKNEKRAQDEDKLKSYAEEQLKSILGLNRKEKKIVLDAGRELMEMLQKSAQKAQSNVDRSESAAAEQGPVVDVQQARNLFPLLSERSLSQFAVPGSTAAANNTNDRSASPTESKNTPGLQESSKELLAFLHKRASKDSSGLPARPLPVEAASSFPSANLDHSPEQDNYEEFESSSDESTYESSREEVEHSETEWDPIKEDELLNVKPIQNIERPQPSTTAKQRQRPKNDRVKTSNLPPTSPSPTSEAQTSKPKFRVLKRGDKLENIFSESKPEMQSEPREERPISPISSNETSSNSNKSRIPADSSALQPTSTVSNAKDLLSILKKPATGHLTPASVSSPVSNNSAAGSNFQNDAYDNFLADSAPTQTHHSPTVVDSSSNVQTEVTNTSEQGPNELLKLLKKPHGSSSHTSSPLSESSQVNNASNELLGLLHNKRTNPNSSNITANVGSQFQPYGIAPESYSIQHNLQPQTYQVPQMTNSLQQFLPPQNIPVHPQGYPMQQPYLYHPPINGYQNQQIHPSGVTPTSNNQPTNQSQQLLNILHKPNTEQVSETPASASSELLSILKR